MTTPTTVSLTMLVAACLTLPSARAATPTTVSGTYESTIVDWPTGKTGTVRFVGNTDRQLPSAPVDATGHFSIPLPDLADVTPDLTPVSGLFAPLSNLRSPENACVGQGTAVPQDAHYNEYGLSATIDGGEAITLKFKSSTRVPVTIGQTESAFYYFDKATTLNGMVTCATSIPLLNVSYRGTFPAGWSLPTAVLTAVSANDVSTLAWTPAPLPRSVTWHLYNLVSGIGLSLDNAPSDIQGLRVNSVTPGLPADRAGIQADDVVVEVDGQDITALSISEIATLIRGPAGAPVTLGIRRGTETAIQQITVVRAELQVP